MNQDYLNENMMGPNALIIIKELMNGLSLKKGTRVLDLGCGKGLSTAFLAKEYGVEVFAVDLWICANENYQRFCKQNLANQVVPLQLDALNLPFPEKFFDAVISVDAYHYFGNNDTYFKNILRPLLKDEALVAIAIPGMKMEIDTIPKEMESLWDKEALKMWHSINWWQPKFAPFLKNFKIMEMDCFDKAWQDWLACDNQYAIEDRKMIETDGGRYMNLIKIIGNIK